MKKIVISTIASVCLSLSAFAQGSINIDSTSDSGVTTQGGNAASANTATTWFTGTISLQVWYAASVTGGQLAAINAFLNQSNGASAAEALLVSDGFVEAETTNPTNGTVGAVTGAVNDGSPSFNPSTIGLSSSVPTSTSAYLALVGTWVSGSGASSGWAGVVAFANSTGGNPNVIPPGVPANLTGWDNSGDNLVLSPNSVPEPATMALLGLGGAALLGFRRRKS